MINEKYEVSYETAEYCKGAKFIIYHLSFII